jgi:(p)ppGpp synthase/HD superfamily hydrolase
MNYIQKAAAFAEKAHQKQLRKDGKPYFTHVEAVANIVRMDWFTLIPREAQDSWNDRKADVMAAAYLHDVIEDCNVTKQQLIDEGFSIMTAEIVDELSKKPGETYFDFIMRIHDGVPNRVGVVAVKLADLRHNMSDLNEGSLKDKYRFAEYILDYFNPKNTEIQYNIDMNETDNYDLARAIFTDKVNEIVNDPKVLNGYARALGHVEGLVFGMLIDIPAVREYIVNRYQKINQ